MLVLVQNIYKVNKKEGYGEILARVHSLFRQVDMEVRFDCSFCESPGDTGLALDRLFKRHPQLRELHQVMSIPGLVTQELPMISGNQDTIPFELVCEVANGIPRSYPFPIATTQFVSDAFTPKSPLPESYSTGISAVTMAGFMGRKCNLTATYEVEIADNAKAPALPPAPLAPLLALLGKPAKTNRTSLAAAPPNHAPLQEIVYRYRQRMAEISLEANLPHTLPPLLDALANRSVEHYPLKPALVARFGPMGFRCKGGSGIFNLYRKSANNHVIGLMLDVGTYSRMLTAQFEFFTPGYRASIHFPVARGLNPLQYPIGSAEQWAQLVDNLATLMNWLEPTLLRELDAAAPPAPAWFEAPSS